MYASKKRKSIPLDVLRRRIKKILSTKIKKSSASEKSSVMKNSLETNLNCNNICKLNHYENKN